MKSNRLRNIIKRALNEEKQLLRESYFPRGEFNVTGVYNDVKPSYTFRSQGPVPGRVQGPGYDFESKGPEGVNYFTEEDSEGPNPWAVCTSSLGLEGKKRKDYTNLEKGKYEKCVLGMKKKIKESKIKSVIQRVLNENKLCGDKKGDDCGKCGDGFTWQDQHVTNSCACKNESGAVCHETGKTNLGGGGTKRDKKGIYRGAPIKEDENIAATMYQQDTSHRDAETGQVIASTEMLDIMNVKLDTLTDLVTDIKDNLSRDWV